ncbi:hypothetical protein ZIOFF_005928 [Zingiber officinale]|uniref:Uncharacterized protein n=1 Tax=Zingiber officinale TaxID=94328 RepID=A0A8J5LMY3_ZINOF|nr:hypothetical protein ZIOFF_005928 [Zingiber officinale]
MGRSSTSCFKIIGCGAGDAIDDDELVVDETKALADKRRWSFRKRSSKHQVLNDSVISEPISVCSSKQSQEALTTNLHSSKYNLLENLPVQEKPVKMCPIPSDGVNSEAPSSLSNRILTPAISALNEPDLITLQAAIRGYLARKLLHKFKSVVKLQAVVRGHLVRRQAIGTLRCIIAIIRMQAFVKARHSRQLIGNIPTSRDAKFEPQVSAASLLWIMASSSPARVETVALTNNPSERHPWIAIVGVRTLNHNFLAYACLENSTKYTDLLTWLLQAALSSFEKLMNSKQSL